MEMPVFVGWKWIEKTKSYLVVFHFIDDFSNTNLRFEEPNQATMITDSHKKAIEKPWISWAPSHIEIGVLMDVLRYANIIDGLPYGYKRELKPYLEAHVIKGNIGDNLFIYHKIKENICIQLCSDYIDYLKGILKPYL
jgi:hypothetical protein